MPYEVTATPAARTEESCTADLPPVLHLNACVRASQGNHGVMWHEIDACTAVVPLGISGAAAPAYVLANPGRYGYYRVNYSAPLWQALAAAAESPSVVPAVDLAGAAGCA